MKPNHIRIIKIKENIKKKPKKKKFNLINIKNITKFNCIYLIFSKAVSHKHIITASEESCLIYIGKLFFFDDQLMQVFSSIQVLNK